MTGPDGTPEDVDEAVKERTAVAVISTEPRMQLVYRPRWKTDHHPWVFFNTVGEELFRFSHGEVEEDDAR